MQVLEDINIFSIGIIPQPTGIASVIWFKGIYPPVSDWIEKVLMDSIGICVTWIMLIFMICDMFVSCMALVRSGERAKGN